MEVLTSALEAAPYVPDWRNSETYKAILSLPRPAIAWEFLRRNPTYQAEFSEGRTAPEDPNFLLVRLRRPIARRNHGDTGVAQGNQ